MSKKRCTACPNDYQGTFPLRGPGFSRRGFFRLTGTAIAGSYFADVVSPPRVLEAATAPSLHGTARNGLLIFLSGAPSHIDTFDLKEGAWTPADFRPTTYGGSIRFPQGLLPKIADHLPKLTLVRSGLAWAAVHSLAQTWAQISRNPTGALGDIAPHIGAVVALEAQADRRPSDVLPGFVSLNAANVAGPSAGYLPAKYAPFKVTANAAGLTTLSPQQGDMARFQQRIQLIDGFDSDRNAAQPLGRNAADMDEFYKQARVLMESPDVNNIFKYTTDEQTRYGNTGFGSSLVVARNLLASNRGTRFVQVTQGGWDMHANIYARTGNSLFTLGAQLDNGVGALLTDLAARPGVAPGKTLLDETLVMIFGEFGRTVGNVNAQAGRDHYQRMSMVLAGGGIKGGRVVGETDAQGRGIKEFGWSANRDVRSEDITSTLYSALGIDYTTVRMDDPIGRGFPYVPYAADGVYKPIEEIF